MRKMFSSGKFCRNTSLSFLDDARSWPNGFSITRRASLAVPDFAIPSATTPNILGGTAR